MAASKHSQLTSITLVNSGNWTERSQASVMVYLSLPQSSTNSVTSCKITRSWPAADEACSGSRVSWAACSHLTRAHSGKAHSSKACSQLTWACTTVGGDLSCKQEDRSQQPRDGCSTAPVRCHRGRSRTVAATPRWWRSGSPLMRLKAGAPAWAWPHPEAETRQSAGCRRPVTPKAAC